MLRSAIHAVDLSGVANSTRMDLTNQPLPSIAEQKPSQETDPAIGGLPTSNCSLPRRKITGGLLEMKQGQPKQKPKGRVQTIKNTAHYRPVAVTSERGQSIGSVMGREGRSSSSGAHLQNEEFKSNMESRIELNLDKLFAEIGELKSDQQRMAHQIEMLQMENHELRQTQKAREAEEHRRIAMLKQSYQQMNLQLRAECEGYAKKVEELSAAHDILAQRTRYYSVVENFFIKVLSAKQRQEPYSPPPAPRAPPLWDESYRVDSFNDRMFSTGDMRGPVAGIGTLGSRDSQILNQISSLQKELQNKNSEIANLIKHYVSKTQSRSLYKHVLGPRHHRTSSNNI